MDNCRWVDDYELRLWPSTELMHVRLPLTMICLISILSAKPSTLTYDQGLKIIYRYYCIFILNAPQLVALSSTYAKYFCLFIVCLVKNVILLVGYDYIENCDISVIYKLSKQPYEVWLLTLPFFNDRSSWYLCICLTQIISLFYSRLSHNVVFMHFTFPFLWSFSHSQLTPFSNDWPGKPCKGLNLSTVINHNNMYYLHCVMW